MAIKNPEGAAPEAPPDQLLELSRRNGRMWIWRLDVRAGLLRSNGGPAASPEVEQFELGPVMNLFDTADRVRVRSELDRIAQTGEPFSLMVSGVPEAAAETVYQVDADAESDKTGAVVTVFGTVRNVSAQVFAERERRRVETRRQDLLEALDKAGVGIGVQDHEGKLRNAHPALLAIAGVEREEEILGKRLSGMRGDSAPDFHGKPDDITVEEGVGRSSDHVVNLDVDWMRPDGSLLSVLVRLAPLPGGERAMIVLDQTEQKRARDEIEARELRLRAILDAIDAAGIGYSVLDEDGRIYDVSPTLLSTLRLRPDGDYLGDLFGQLVRLPRSVREQVELEYQTYSDGPQQSHVYPDFVMELADGAMVQLHARSTPLPGIGRLVLVIDRTDRWQLEQRQAEIERHLQEVQKMEAVGQLAGGVAHEINNMLHPIRTFARAAGRATEEERRIQLLDRVLDCADKAADIVRETLSFARGDGQATEALSLNELLHKAVSFSRDLSMRDLELEFDLPANELVVRVNETEFIQVLLNLMRNAADAMGEKGIISLLLSERLVGADEVIGLEPGAYARLRVKDTGPGIPEEVAERIFEPFFTTKETGKGTGLGLSVVYGIVKRWGGTIEVASPPEGGAEFDILLPIWSADAG